MAKFITKFDTVNAYNEAAPSFVLPHVSLTKDNNILHYHPISSLAVGTYLYNDGTTGTTPNSNVVGICVIPDGLLPDRKARFMSVKAITTETTENDIINEINWADNTRTLLPKQYTEVPCVGLNEDSGTVVITNQVEHSHEDGHMPSDSRDFTGLTDPYDITTMFSYDAYEHYIPSPFMKIILLYLLRAELQLITHYLISMDLEIRRFSLRMVTWLQQNNVQNLSLDIEMENGIYQQLENLVSSYQVLWQSIFI